MTVSRVIVIDPGHGGSDPGAVGPSGLREKDVTLAVSKKLAAYLCDIADIHLTRWTDKELRPDDNSDLAARATLANSINAELFISIHCNSASPVANGVETYAYKPGGNGERLARLVQEELVKATGLTNRGVKFANYYVLRRTSMPAILVELAFISNPQEEALLGNPDFQDVCARAIAVGIKRYYGIPVITSQEVAQVAKKWQEDIMVWGRAEINISAQHKADESAPKWFVVAVGQRVLDKAVQKALEAIKKELEAIRKELEAIKNA